MINAGQWLVNYCEFGLTGYPITSTLMGLGAFPASNGQWLGMLGMHGTYEAIW